MHCDQDRPSAGGEPLTAPIIDVSAFHLRHAGECAGIHDFRCAELEKGVDTGIRRHDDMGRATSHGFGRLFGVGAAAYAMQCDQDRPSAGGEPLTAPIIDVSAFHSPA